jgi:23S rRNA pseudouridine1911/1915/1917 synthase
MIFEKVSSVWSIPSDMQGLRADQYLVRRIGRISRERAQRIILAKDFLLDEQAIKPSARVKEGQKARLIRFAPDRSEDIKEFSVGIIYEDDEMLVVNKPAGLSIHPSANCLYRTLTHWLRQNFLGQKINPCHRIDKETSGIVVCAKTRKMESIIKKAFLNKKVTKTYVAVVSGLCQSQTIDIPLGLQKDKGVVAIRMVKDLAGKAAKTRVKPIFKDEAANRTLLMCRPYTGRQHQIRAHLSLIGHGIISDKLYSHGDAFFDEMCRGNDEILKELVLPRHALHAASLKFMVGHKKYRFKCPIPKDLLSLIEKP